MRQDTAHGRDPVPLERGGLDVPRYDNDRPPRYRSSEGSWARHGHQGGRSSSSRLGDEPGPPRERSWARGHRWRRSFAEEDRRGAYRSGRNLYEHEHKRRRASPSPAPPRPGPVRPNQDTQGEYERGAGRAMQQGIVLRGVADRARHDSPVWRRGDEARPPGRPVPPAPTRANIAPPGPAPPRPSLRGRSAQEVKPPPPPPPPPGPPPVPVARDGTPRIWLDEAYEIVAQVGEGTYGQVYKASAERSGALVALKKIRMEGAREGFPVTSMREMKLLQSLRHENVIRLHETMTSRTGSVYMVFEYMEHDLNGILVHPEVQFTDAHRKSLVAQLLRGLEYLHQRSVLHRDLKGSNLLLNNEGVLKLADFGLARSYAKRQAGDYTNRVVTLWYRPPELLLGATQYGPEVDVWGAGCLFVELFTRQALFQGRDEIHQLHQITRVLGPLTPQVWPDVMSLPWYDLMRLEKEQSETPILQEDGAPDTPDAFASQLPPSAKALVRRLLVYDPKQRWSATQALSEPYFTEAPNEERPAQYVPLTDPSVLSSLQGEWHEMQSKRALRHARASAT